MYHCFYPVTCPLLQPVLRNGQFFTYETMAWLFLVLIWLAGFLLCWGGRRWLHFSLSLFCACWTDCFINWKFRSFFYAHDYTVFHFAVLFTGGWIALLLFRILFAWLLRPLQSSIQKPHSTFFGGACIVLGMLMIFSFGLSEFQNLRTAMIVSVFGGLAGGLHLSVKTRREQRHVTYQDLHRMEMEDPK